MGQVLLHAHLGSAELLLLAFYLLESAQHRRCYRQIACPEVNAEHHSRVFGNVFLVYVELGTALHDLRFLPNPLYILGVVALELLHHGGVALRAVVLRHVLAVVAQHDSRQFLVEVGVPLAAVVLEYVVLLLGFVLGALQLHAASQ